MAEQKTNKKEGSCLYCKTAVEPGGGVTWISDKTSKRLYKHSNCSKESNRATRKSSPTQMERKPLKPDVMCACGHMQSVHANNMDCCAIKNGGERYCHCKRFKSVPEEWITFSRSPEYKAWMNKLPSRLSEYVTERLGPEIKKGKK